MLGNTKVALSITTDPTVILAGAKANLEEPDIALVVTATHLDDAKPTIKVLPLAPLPHCALRAEVWTIYEQRHINKGREFYDEFEQEVVFIHDVDKKKYVDIVGADDASPFVWQIQLYRRERNRRTTG